MIFVSKCAADERLLQAAAAAGVRPEAGDWANALAISSHLTEHAAGKGRSTTASSWS